MKIRLETMVNAYNVKSKKPILSQVQNFSVYSTYQQLIFQQLIEGMCDD